MCVWLCVCVCALQSTLFLSKSNSIRREHPEHALWFNICVWLYEKENTYCLLFLSFTTDWFSFPSSCLGPSCLFPSCFFFFSFALSIWLYWVISFLSPTEGCCCGSRCGRLIAWKLDFAPVWQTLQTIGGRHGKGEQGWGRAEQSRTVGGYWKM